MRDCQSLICGIFVGLVLGSLDLGPVRHQRRKGKVALRVPVRGVDLMAELLWSDVEIESLASIPYPLNISSALLARAPWFVTVTHAYR